MAGRGVTVDRHDPHARCQRDGCGHARAVHTGRHFGSSWTVCTEPGCPCWAFDDDAHDNPQVDNPVDKLHRLTQEEVDNLTDAGFTRGVAVGVDSGWNDALDAALQLLRTYRDNASAYGSRDYQSRVRERQRIIEQLETLKR